MHTLTIGKNDAGQRLDKFLSKNFKTMPPALMYKYIRLKKIKVNRKRAEQKQVLCEGDTVELFIKEEFFEAVTPDNAYLKITPRLDVVYEDENILLCDKRPGVIVHADDGEDYNTLINHIKAYLYQRGEYRPDREHAFAPALCNRIDRNTGGIVIAAKTAEALRVINEKIRAGEIDKRYLCAAHGIFEKKRGTLRGYLKKDSTTNMVSVFEKKTTDSAQVKEIVTEYEVLSECGDLSLCEVHLITGRTHQIRAHLSSVGHPLLGDGKYGINREDRHAGYKFQALYSYKLTFAFTTPSSLDYLRGKTFAVDRSHIWFLKEFSTESATEL
ncbi:MAG: RluA family pseudouridine synthase [Clostridia bacterium]|nr:RluA family pseudouridine synthase [Clostridia bacterium]